MQFLLNKRQVWSAVLVGACIFSSCKKDNGLKQEVAELSSRVSALESQITQINNSVLVLQQQGKLNTDEVSSLKTLSNSLSVLTNELKASGTASATDIANLKSSLQLVSTTVQVEDVKKTVNQLSALVDKNYSEQKVTDKSNTALQTLVAQLSSNLSGLEGVASIQEISGRIEKGAFTKGSLVSLYEMDSTLTQTGRSFNTTISDNFGSFSLKVQNLKGKFCRAVADGFYFNEVAGQNSLSKISLTGLIKVNSSATMNINVLTHLERPRVEYLIKQGKTFDEAKTQAVTEVLKVFGIENSGIKKAEDLNLIGSAKRNKILLSISSILLGFRTDSELMEILTDISQDLETDGILSEKFLGNDLATHLYYMDTAAVVKNVRAKYASIYADSVISKVDLSGIKTFLDANLYKKSYDLISYPATASGYKNLLSDVTDNSGSYFINASVKNGNIRLRIELTCYKENDPNTTYDMSAGTGSTVGWTITNSADRKTLILESNGTGLQTAIVGLSPANYYFNFKRVIAVKYFENGSSVPTKTKTVLSYQ
ncbi:hypothetical protein [Mucilaginibacter sp. CSA2-8R]|uniref:hypothetical protein n=1 Tax=Mucilaginibacter sp. CSA2-8R TaxID=3141542 RepID=UPI00315CEFA8